MGLGSWSGVGADLKRDGKEVVMFPDLVRIIYNGISKTVYDGQIFSYKPDLERQFLIFHKNAQFPSFSCENIVFKRLGLYFYTEMKTSIFKVILPNFIE